MAALKNHPGMWLRDDAAAAINALEDKYGVIVINSAGRYVWEQQDLIDRFDRGEPGIYMPYRPAEGSPHVRNGGTAVDVYNYTDDRAKLREFGFVWTYGMDDPPHYDFTGWTPTTPPPTAPILSEEDDMAIIEIDAGPKGKHIAALGNGVFRHFVGGDDIAKACELFNGGRPPIPVPLKSLDGMLRTAGCDLKIWDLIRDAAGVWNFVVRDPLTGTTASGNVWTAIGEARALGKALAR